MRPRGLGLPTIVNGRTVIINYPSYYSLLSYESAQLGPAQLLLWQRTPDLQLTSRKPPGKQLVETKHDKAIPAPNEINAEPSQNVTNLELQSSTHTPPVLHDVESSGLLLFPFCLCFGTLCCLSGSFPRLACLSGLSHSALEEHSAKAWRTSQRCNSTSILRILSFVNLCCSCILTWTCHISSLHGSVLCRSQICAEAAVNLQRNGVSMTVYIMTQKASRNSQMISIKDASCLYNALRF